MRRRFLFFITIFSLAGAFYAQPADLNLIDESGKLGAQVYWDSLSGSGLLEKNGHQVSFRAGDGFVLHDYKKLAVTDAPVVRDGVLYVTRNFLSSADRLFKTENSDSSGFKIGAILIDPGHGGKDPGAMATHKISGKSVTVREKDINLAVGKMLYSRLRTAYPDKKILMTRDTDKYLTLQERTDIANAVRLGEKEAILYVSVHVNSSLDKKASGYETWYLSPGYRRTVLEKTGDVDKDLFSAMNIMMEEEYITESILIAKFVMDGIAAQVGNLSSPRGIKAEEWFVVRNSNMPAVLIEVGFLSNEKEAGNLADNAYLQKMALGIYNGMSAFVTHFERSRGFTGAR